jgi:hypothetical protein
MHYAISAQGFMADAVNPGRVYREMKSSDIAGSPLLFENWTAARVKIINGKVITGLLVNFDVYNNKPLYLNREETFEFGDELEYIETGFDGSTERKMFMNGFVSNQLNSKTFVQVLNEGKYRLLKHVKKVLVENKGSYGSAAENKVLEQQNFYFIANNQVATPAKLGKPSLEECAGRQWNKLSQYIDANQLNVKKEAGFIKALEYLNTLTP